MLDNISKAVGYCKDAAATCVKYSVPHNSTVATIGIAVGWYGKKCAELYYPWWVGRSYLSGGSWWRIATAPVVVSPTIPYVAYVASAVAAYAAIILANIVSRYFSSELKKEEPPKKSPPPEKPVVVSKKVKEGKPKNGPVDKLRPVTDSRPLHRPSVAQQEAAHSKA